MKDHPKTKGNLSPRGGNGTALRAGGLSILSTVTRASAPEPDALAMATILAAVAAIIGVLALGVAYGLGSF